MIPVGNALNEALNRFQHILHSPIRIPLVRAHPNIEENRDDPNDEQQQVEVPRFVEGIWYVGEEAQPAENPITPPQEANPDARVEPNPEARGDRQPPIGNAQIHRSALREVPMAPPSPQVMDEIAAISENLLEMIHEAGHSLDEMREIAVDFQGFN